MSICCDRITRINFNEKWLKPYLLPKDHRCFQDVTDILSRIQSRPEDANAQVQGLASVGISRMDGTREVYSISQESLVLLKLLDSSSFGGWQDETTQGKIGAPGHRYNNLFRVPYGRQIEQILKDKQIPFGVVREYLAPIGPKQDKPKVFDYVVVSEKIDLKTSVLTARCIQEWSSEIRIEFFHTLCTLIREAGYINARFQNFCFHRTETMQLLNTEVPKFYVVDLQPYAVMTERSDNLLSPGFLREKSISRFSHRQARYAGLYTLFKECQYLFGEDVKAVVTLYLQKAHKRLEPSCCSRIFSIFCCCCCFSRKKNPEEVALLKKPEL